MLYFYRSILLMVCAGLSVCGLVVMVSFIDQGHDAFRNFTMEKAYHFFILFSFGCVFCLIFGVPFLFLIDKYVKNFWAKYIVGGAVVGWGVWFVISGPLFSLQLLLNPSAWNWRGSSIFFFAGMSTGVLFTLVLKFLSIVNMYYGFDEIRGAKR